MTFEQRALIDRAGRALETARKNLSDDDAPAAVNRAYYAAFYAATAALLEVGETPKSHHGVQNRFYVHFVVTGRLPKVHGEILGHAFLLRQRADYEATTTFDKTAAADLISDVERFVRAAEGLLPERS